MLSRLQESKRCPICFCAWGERPVKVRRERARRRCERGHPRHLLQEGELEAHRRQVGLVRRGSCEILLGTSFPSTTKLGPRAWYPFPLASRSVSHDAAARGIFELPRKPHLLVEQIPKPEPFFLRRMKQLTCPLGPEVGACPAVYLCSRTCPGSRTVHEVLHVDQTAQVNLPLASSVGLSPQELVLVNEQPSSLRLRQRARLTQFRPRGHRVLFRLARHAKSAFRAEVGRPHGHGQPPTTPRIPR
eukprot:scaffold78558_cov70-Phaeocystis_antarctica.AAC.2